MSYKYLAFYVNAVIFFFPILAVVIWTGRKKGNDSREEIKLAGRSIGLIVGIFTMTGKLYKKKNAFSFETKWM